VIETAIPQLPAVHFSDRLVWPRGAVFFFACFRGQLLKVFWVGAQKNKREKKPKKNKKKAPSQMRRIKIKLFF
jgi:hypothetical protein